MKILRGLICISLLGTLLSLSARAEGVKPMSLSYQNIIECFPELSDPGNSFKVNLNRLHEMVDRRFATLNSSVRHRIAVFKDGNDDQKKRLTYTRQGESKNYTLKLEKLDDQGNGTEIPLTQAQRINPKPREIGNILALATMISDDYMYDDTKLNEVVLTYRRRFQETRELQLSDKLHKKTLSCENQKDLGIICTCSKK